MSTKKKHSLRNHPSYPHDIPRVPAPPSPATLELRPPAPPRALLPAPTELAHGHHSLWTPLRPFRKSRKDPPS